MRSVIVLLAACLAVSACGPRPPRNCPPVRAKAILTETEELRQYLQTAGIQAQEDSMGYFYSIKNAGSGKQPSSCSDVTVNYTGTFTSGEVFDQGSDVSFNLSQLILGWQMGIPKLREGGQILLYVPPSIAYGDETSGKIPGHSMLVFKIDLKTVE
ncbi:MAG: FKBP-type peptidylprolyl isomerase [Sphingobacteriales bacterium]|nr:MAG: FKBP-type peptidylprolyl isomerase [Sphingobacteriales bacterium]